MRRTCLTVCVWLCALAGVLVFGAGVSGAVGQFGSEGSEAGQFDEAYGVAVDGASGDVYLVDRNNQRVEKFTGGGGFLFAWGWGVADGSTPAFQVCTTTCFAGIPGSGAGQLAQPEGLAVDNDPLSSSYGDVYVIDKSNNRVEKFDPEGKFLLAFGREVNAASKGDVCLAGEECVAGAEGKEPGEFEFPGGGVNRIAVGSDGAVYVADVGRVQKFTPEGAYSSQVALPEETGTVNGLTVDTAGDFYVFSREGLSGVREYSPTGTPIRTLDGEGRPQALALDGSGDLFVDDGPNETVEGPHHILEYDSTGNELASFDSGGEGGSRGIAFGQTSERLYVINRGDVRLVATPPSGPLVVEGSEFAEPQPTTATLNATVNPERNDTTYRFEYGASAAYGTSVPIPDADIGSGFEDHAVSAAVSGLSVSTTYHFRVVASNSAGTTYGLDQTFTTLPPALIDSESAVNVASSSATLEGEVNPLGTDTRYSFEYGTTTAYGSHSPLPDGLVGSGTSDQLVVAHVQGLEPGTVYHYRLTATNTIAGTLYVVRGKDRTFTTQFFASAGRFTLPDGRSWELVSPPDKQGAGLEATNHDGGMSEASADGTGITYMADAPTEPEPRGNPSFKSSQILSRRGAGGWSSQDIATPHDTAITELKVGTNPEYKFFSSDLSLALVEPEGKTPLSTLADGSEKTVYVRNAQDGSYLPLVTSANAPAGMKLGEVRFDGATSDMRHIIFASDTPLDPRYPSSGGLFEWTAGGNLKLVSVLPNREPAPKSELSLGLHDGDVRNAISSDGSRIVWATQGEQGEGTLDMYDAESAETIRLDTAQGAPEPSRWIVHFDAASSDGSKVFFTDTARLTGNSTASGSGGGAPDLYVFEVTSAKYEKLKGKLTDLTVDSRRNEPANVRGEVLGASEDGSYVYFVAAGVLSGTENAEKETAQAGANNLYVSHRGSDGWLEPRFITTLSLEDDNVWGAGGAGFALTNLSTLTVRVSPNGRYLAFMSDQSSTGYDNRDAVSGVPDEEVYVYDAAAEALRCASCNPTGARPSGIQIPYNNGTAGGVPLADRQQNWTGRWLAASVPGWYSTELGGGTRYQARYLSDSGRLFFNSSDALVPSDTNGTWDVYEYEPGGTGGCARANVSFSVRSEGCVGLISSGGSPEESIFVDASENGDDAFFLTKAHLARQDFDTANDLYDAKVCTTTSPCLQAPPVGAPPCVTGDSCKAAPTPQPSVLGPAASATFSGAGNVRALGRASGVSGRSLSRAQKLARALKACRRKRGDRRLTCRRSARRRFGGPVHAARAGSSLILHNRTGR